MKLLVADDAPLIRSRVASQLRKMTGVKTVLESSDYSDTLKVIRLERPDVLVLDLFMPGGTGLDVLREIADVADRPQVIVLTAWGDNTLRDRCLAAGADHFFEKGSGFLKAMATVQSIVTDGANDQTAMAGWAPDLQKQVVTSATSDAAAKTSAGLSVLIVEDHDFQRRVLARVLRTMGVQEIHEAADGEQALAIIKTRPDDVQLIVCDLDMPNMDGMEFMRHLGETGTSAALIITSTHEASILNSVQTMCRAYGIRPLGVLEKPVSRERLQGLMARLQAPTPVAPVVPVGLVFTAAQILQGISRGEFEPVFQPKVELATGRVVGAEALARWRHPELGVIAPSAFIEPLESSNQMDQLTFMMLKASALACRRWRDRNLKLSVSVNLSLASLTDTGLAERIARTVVDLGVDPRSMTLEVTETAAMTELAPALENLARLRLRGFGLSIDDFGTGFASMQQLGRVAFTELKIDRGFVIAMADQHEARAIVESSIGMARRLGITAVAEGIETHAQWDALRSLGCHQGQGYVISKPVDEQEFLGIRERAPQ